MAKLLAAPTKNAVQKTLSAQLLSSAGNGDPISFDDVDGILNLPGVLVINRVDTSGTSTAAKREYIEYSGTSGNTVLIETRNVDNSNAALTHAVGSIVEFIPDVTWADRIYDTLSLYIDPTDNTVRDIQGGELILDADGDTSITADTDDQVDFKVGGSDVLRVKTADLDLAGTSPNIQVGGADPYMVITLPAESWAPATTSPCSDATKVEAGTNDIDYWVLDFDTSSDEVAFKNFQMPDNWDAGVIQFRYIWTNAAGLTTETVNFALSGRSFANDDAIDQAVGTAVGVSDTWIAQGDVHISSWSSDVTLAGTPAAGEYVHLEIMRDVSEDNLTGDARLMAVQLRYKISQYAAA